MSMTERESKDNSKNASQTNWNFIWKENEFAIYFNLFNLSC